jgi:hypothetical protein
MMKQLLAFAALSALMIAFGALAFGPAAFAGTLNSVSSDNFSPVVQVDADCYAIGDRIAQEQGGTLAKAVPVTVDGQPMCKIVVLVPGAEGERPKRMEFFEPQV